MRSGVLQYANAAHPPVLLIADLFLPLAGSPDWSLDDLVDTLRQRSATAGFIDDCCLLQATFN